MSSDSTAATKPSTERTASGPARTVRSVLASVVSFGFVFGPAAAYLAGERSANIENRALAKAPQVSDGWDALDAVSPWLSDHLPGRSKAVQASAWFDYHVLGELPKGSQNLAPTPASGGEAPAQAAAPKVVKGSDNYLFLGEDFTRACVYSTKVASQLQAYLKLVDIIEASGRTVVFAVGTNKSSVTPNVLPRAVPDGQCALDGIARQKAAIAAVKDPRFVSANEELTKAYASGGLPYWRTDTHWNDSGSALYAAALGKALGLDTSTFGTKVYSQTWPGDLSALIGLNETETMSIKALDTGATVSEDPVDPAQVKAGVNYGPQHWTSTPSSSIVQGKTLLLGDSFTYYGLGSLKPLFADGTFQWFGHVTEADILAQIKASDTVVIELVERNLGTNHPYGQAAFQEKVRKALGSG